MRGLGVLGVLGFGSGFGVKGLEAQGLELGVVSGSGVEWSKRTRRSGWKSRKSLLVKASASRFCSRGVQSNLSSAEAI